VKYFVFSQILTNSRLQSIPNMLHGDGINIAIGNDSVNDLSKLGDLGGRDYWHMLAEGSFQRGMDSRDMLAPELWKARECGLSPVAMILNCCLLCICGGWNLFEK